MSEYAIEEGLKCPYCGDISTPEDTDYEIYKNHDDRLEHECHNCGETFHWACNFQYRWDTYTKEEQEYL